MFLAQPLGIEALRKPFKHCVKSIFCNFKTRANQLCLPFYWPYMRYLGGIRDLNFDFNREVYKRERANITVWTLDKNIFHVFY